MFVRPKQLEVASALSLVGAVVSLVAVFIMFSSEEDATNKMVVIGLTLLVAVMFLAMSGAFGAKTRWSWKSAMLFIFLTATLIVVTYLYGLSTDVATIIQFAVVIIIAILVSGKASSIWFEKNRIWSS